MPAEDCTQPAQLSAAPSVHVTQLSLFTPDIHSDSSELQGLTQWAHLLNSMAYENDVHSGDLQKS